MSAVNKIFESILRLTHEGKDVLCSIETEIEGQCKFVSVWFENLFQNKPEINNETIEEINDETISSNFQLLKTFLTNIFNEIDELAKELNNDGSILVSVREQKLLRTCFQLVSSLGVSFCLIPGLGISLSKRCSSAAVLPSISLTDAQKYEMLVACTDFFTRSYKVPVLKNIILTFHLSDYLAALIQLSFAPLKKPGAYSNFIMTPEMYNQFKLDRQKYVEVYENLVQNCFQPILMKELLILQSATSPSPPVFARRVIAKEMSKRLLSPGGLLSLIRCFIESYNVDTSYEWKKIDMICKIVAVQHGNDSQEKYLENICSQITQILTLKNTHYLTTTIACVKCLNEKYPECVPVKVLIKEIFQAFDYNVLITKSNLPGTLILSPQEVENKVTLLHACVCMPRLKWRVAFMSPNLYVLFLLGVKCTNNEELKIKIKDTLLNCLAEVNKDEICVLMETFLFGKHDSNSSSIVVDEYEAGLAIKCEKTDMEYPKNDALLYFLHLFKASTDNEFIQRVFEASLLILIDLSGKRLKKANREVLLPEEDDVIILDDTDEKYANILQLLSEMSTSPKVISSIKRNPAIVLQFIEFFISKTISDSYEECLTIALVLLNTILSNSNITDDLEKRLTKLIPLLKVMAEDDSSFNNILCKEALSLISSEQKQQEETAYGRAISDVFDSLLPVRAHGIIELTKLIDSKDPEAVSKKHYIFCLLQEQLKDSDSYVYLSAINGIASLGAYCPEDVLQVLCKEFLQTSHEQQSIETKDYQNKCAELRMKIGDVIVKLTKRLGEMAIVHKTILLNTVLCGCRDQDPLIRTSALSNLAEIALVLNYKIGSIIYEILLCVWSIIETDKAIECRRAAVMVISSLLKGLGKETLTHLKDNLLPIYRTLKNVYRDPDEDSVVRLHAQIALEELNHAVHEFLSPALQMEKQIFVLDMPEDILK